MGNTRAQDRRRGVKRPGPAQREREQVPDPTVAARENAAERQRQCRARKRLVQRRSEQLVRQGAESEIPCRRDVLRVSSKICSLIVDQLENDCDDPEFQRLS